MGRLATLGATVAVATAAEAEAEETVEAAEAETAEAAEVEAPKFFVFFWDVASAGST